MHVRRPNVQRDRLKGVESEVSSRVRPADLRRLCVEWPDVDRLVAPDGLGYVCADANVLVVIGAKIEVLSGANEELFASLRIVEPPGVRVVDRRASIRG